MIIPRLFLDRNVALTPKGYRAIAHERPRRSIFTVEKHRFFPTEEEAWQWLRDRKAESSVKFSTQSVLWVSDDLVPTIPYTLPRLTTERTHDGILTVHLDGMRIAIAKTGRELKRQIADYPPAQCLYTVPCKHCGRLPIVNLHAGTLSHKHRDCKITVVMPHDPRTPPPMQIAVWNRKLANRPREAKLTPMTMPHFMVLGALREPTDNDFMKRLRRIEAIFIE
jgi:hypothetical protein